MNSKIVTRPFIHGSNVSADPYHGIRFFDWEKPKNELTGAQSMNVPVMSDGVVYPLEPLIPYSKRQKMLRHPSIAMARQLAVAPMVLAEWTIKLYPEAPKSAYWLINHEIMKRKNQILERAFKDCIDFGFSCFEIVWNPDGKSETGEDAITISKFKHLFPYTTFLRANPKNGEFAGILQYDILTGTPCYLPQQNVQIFNIDIEGSNHYGNSMLDNCTEAFDNWQKTRLIAMGYLRKIGGAHWVVYYPDGETEYNGTTMANIEIANDLLRQLEANGGMAVPRDVTEFTMGENSRSDSKLWEIQQISDSGATSASYTEQLKYDDDQIVMGLMFPPNALLEGHYGTKAEAVAHAEAAVASMEMISGTLARMISEQAINQLLELNYGKLARDSAYIETAPITRDNKDLLKEIYLELLRNQETAYGMIDELNIKGIGDKLRVNQF